MSWLSDPQIWIGLVTLTALEIVLGIDNIVFISILSGKLPKAEQPRARQFGLISGMAIRVLLLLSIKYVMRLTGPLFRLFGEGITVRDLILIAGGLFLLYKSTQEIHDKLEGADEHGEGGGVTSPTALMIQMLLLNVVFSIDSVITAIGMVQQVGVMVAAVVIAVGVMLFFSRPVSEFVMEHPTVKMLALSFLLMIGFTLVAEGFHQHIPKGYVYFSMAFSVFVEMLNLKLRKHAPPVRLHEPHLEESNTP